MKAEDIYNAVTELRDDQIEAGERKLPRAVRPARFRRLSAIAAILAVVILVGVLAWPRLGGGAPDLAKYSLARASYPKMEPYPQKYSREKWEAWKESYEALHSGSYCTEELSDYLKTALPAILSGAGDENRVVSPLNLYMGLAMLAECSAGETRDEILSLLNAPNLETLRAQTNTLWKSNYCDDGRLTELLAASIWLRNGWDYNMDTINTLASNYYASVFSGEMGSADYDTALQAWINEQTQNLMEEQVGNVELDAETVLALVTTAYYKAEWTSSFSPAESGTFHSPQGDVTCQFMKGSEFGVNVIEGDGFLAGEKWVKSGGWFGEGGSMYFVLPDEGLRPEDLLGRDDFLHFLAGQAGENGPEQKEAMLYLTVPKFDVSSQLPLQEKLEELGIREAFDAGKADFSPVSPEAEGIFLSDVQHGARLSIDEIGITGAAYTESALACAAAEELHLTLDRPFLFVVTNAENLPIFVGIVNQP
jgi:serine protease inhibitor